jgi:hypothetical protein
VFSGRAARLRDAGARVLPISTWENAASVFLAIAYDSKPEGLAIVPVVPLASLWSI